MTPGQKKLEELWLEHLLKTCDTNDQEVNHARADLVLVEVLKTLGFDNLINEWTKVCLTKPK